MPYIRADLLSVTAGRQTPYLQRMTQKWYDRSVHGTETSDVGDVEGVLPGATPEKQNSALRFAGSTMHRMSVRVLGMQAERVEYVE